MRHVNSPIAARLCCDRGSIGPRSWSSSTKPLNRLMGSSWMNDHDSPISCAAITMRVLRQPSDRDRLSMKISRPIAINSRPSIDADQELLKMPRGARYVVRLSSVKSPFCARDGFDDRVDSGPRDRSRPDRIRRPVSCNASCTGKTVWEHSPTQRKENKLTRINRGVNSPINCLYLLYYRNLHVAPHTGAHVAAWPPCHLAVPCAPPVRATRALPRGFSAASQPELVPRATSLWPLRHVSLQVKPLFVIF